VYQNVFTVAKIVRSLPKTLQSNAVTSAVFWVLKHHHQKYNKNNHLDFNKRLHGNTQYTQKQPHLLQFLDFI